MALSTPFVPYRPSKPPAVVGVYELGWSGAVVYVGMGSIRPRIRAHDRDPDKTFNQYRCLITNCRREARRIERRELERFRRRHGRLPKYNERI